ncbi:putative membrane protein [Corynebacterium glutamicum MB001]|uniref:Ammonia monooxygenase n=1 Tax=Corynebacterium glutamicum (strain ATCC 13032 / DSM 20300 / JCM 1318 / BCRC 11384 / CCUG 27702 / LMG 3730 / NBRC 12168 / NCIMB 10025 / NRRL B-2784 / 534) TaxID=196627 RepID=Q8NU14_CORGL|nr:AbrB family transcriptional regulator [Corynebacterium glutamicum]AGT04147.1 putative membrane protein [Corynebacterium glutamicum MB001]ARV65602.1 ammonia monooxygenase [Corynebacterium glutamicum]ASW12927.1 putative membrane protein [Corynebacterium glutamicum]AUH99769.1 ammonia monooxygenase [Corynebacterium glutamicum]AUI03407.1 ammonia monooxygenase [Corynebacterium glutamicum]
MSDKEPDPHEQIPEKPSRKVIALRWCIVAPLSLAVGWLFTMWGVPAAWILGAILVAGVCALTTGQDLPMAKGVHVFGRSIVAMLAALPLISSSGSELVRFLIPGLVISFFTIAVGIVGGLLLARSRPEILPETGVLSMLAGGASVMPILARELGADFRYVALTQYLRLLVVSMTLPLVTHFFVPGGADLGSPPEKWLDVLSLGEFGTSISVLSLLVLFGIVLAGEPLGRLLRLPAPAVMGPLILTVLVSFVIPDDLSLQPPTVFKIIAFMAIGWMCGGALNMTALKVFSKQLPATFLFIFALLAVCAGAAGLLTWWLDISFFEAYLATSPGALETVLALSSEGSAGPVVVTIQIIRLLAILTIAGLIPTLLRRILRRDR